MKKFKIESVEYITRSIRFSKDLFIRINKVKGKMSLSKFVVKAIEFALDNMEE